MNDIELPDSSTIDAFYAQLKSEAEASGYHLNPDQDFTKDLVEGLLTNRERHGYQSCPCRLASGDKVDDMDIICPCDYRDADLLEWGACYCALYVSKDVHDGKRAVGSIPERRPPEARRVSEDPAPSVHAVWRCRVCGYLCAREAPPQPCPICGATAERFEPFPLPSPRR